MPKLHKNDLIANSYFAFFYDLAVILSYWLKADSASFRLE